MYLRVIILKTYQMMTKKQKENEMNFSQIVDEAALTQLLRFILVFLANQRFVFLICFTVFYKF